MVDDQVLVVVRVAFFEVVCELFAVVGDVVFEQRHLVRGAEVAGSDSQYQM